MARRKTRTIWTPALISALVKQHTDRPDLSHAACNRMFAQKYNMSFLAAKAGYYNHVTKVMKKASVRNVPDVNAALSQRFNVNTRTDTITFDEALEVVRFARQNGYTIVG